MNLQMISFICSRRRRNCDYHLLSGAEDICLDLVAVLWYGMTIAAADSVTRCLR